MQAYSPSPTKVVYIFILLYTSVHFVVTVPFGKFWCFSPSKEAFYSTLETFDHSAIPINYYERSIAIIVWNVFLAASVIIVSEIFYDLSVYTVFWLVLANLVVQWAFQDQHAWILFMLIS